RENAKKLDINIPNSFIIINLMSQSGLYLIFGIILFVLPLTGLLDKEQAISFIVILLFLSGPINSLIAMQSYYTRIFVANKRIKKFFEDFSYSEIKKPASKYTDIKFKSILFKDIQFKYNDDSFRLGPINLEIERGDVIFIIGKNGSGKSTFINILTGLYEPDEGEILLNGYQVNNTDMSYKNLISAIYTDNYLFSQNYDDYSLENNEVYKELLQVMKLDQVITDDKDVSARRTFSKGQGKRMSMIFALMENHPILVLDEWAADQDPYFRKYFYENLIPKFKQNGKTVIAVTHDDMYFEYADKIIKFEDGNIVPEMKIDALMQEQ
ncbi:MAG: ATP-binding cassette domain-containing protein, partial [Clostridiales Family XIII bacterium]|nr:ATP-binding cassette domain-containing protein [Clostridiales Family XIII bacterium]